MLQAMDSVFSGEEAYGKHLDLYTSHSQYLNLKGAVRYVTCRLPCVDS